ncbi:MAG: ribonuclease D [Candidatus Competibacter sp.]|nr:ribonuclease D [Candidatus Competibacter sp.]MDG4605818.1 ribonuclease D [Candidatus Contendobacter sp.]HRD50210.1 ribonuclease D [Candidatus Contendobacter sp.]
MNDLYIADQPALADFCARLQGAPQLALDTEFVREQTYYPQLGLIQIAGPDRVASIDPMALPSLDPLLERIYDPTVTKLLHAGQQDLEIFFHLCGAAPAPVFDTQVAALALGQGDQIGYAPLVRQMLGVELDKAHTRADWRRRPLALEWLRYAADDVRYLPELYRQQRAALEERGWLDALAEDFQRLCHPDRYRLQPRESWRRIREHSRLRGAQRAVLRELAAWREEQASLHDRPRRWIMGDAVLVELTRRMPKTLDDLQHIRGLPPATWQRHGETLLARIAAARAEPPEQWPTPSRRLLLNPEQEAQVDDLLTLITTRANQYHIPIRSVANREDVERLLTGEDSPLRHGWRAALIGRELQADLGGDSRR